MYAVLYSKYLLSTNILAWVQYNSAYCHQAANTESRSWSHTYTCINLFLNSLASKERLHSGPVRFIYVHGSHCKKLPLLGKICNAAWRQYSLPAYPRPVVQGPTQAPHPPRSATGGTRINVGIHGANIGGIKGNQPSEERPIHCDASHMQSTGDHAWSQATLCLRNLGLQICMMVPDTRMVQFFIEHDNRVRVTKLFSSCLC